MGKLRAVVDLPQDAEGLAALLRDLAPELAIVARASGSVLAASELYSLVFRRSGTGWAYRARPGSPFPLAERGEVSDEDGLAVLLGPVLGLDAHTVLGAEDPAGYLRHRALVTTGDADLQEEAAREAAWEADGRRHLAQCAIKVVDDEEGDDG